MPPRQKSLTRGRWRSIALSLLLHACIIGAAVFGWFTWKHKPPPVETMAIEATVVDAKTLGAPPTPQPRPPPPEPVPEPEPEPEPEPPPEEQGPPKPDPAEIEKKQEQERLEAEKLQQEKLEQERLDAEKEAERVAAAQKKAAADKAAAEKKAAEKKRADELAAKKAADERARQDELRRSLEAEERGNAMRNSAEAARWHAQIVARIERAWLKPASAQPGIECIVSVTQVPGGEVTAVRVISCNGGDAALRESVETAVLRASPLPQPPDPALFERNLELTFAPTS
jgi:colicin import membrane protein